MSNASESPPSQPRTQLHNSTDWVRDITLWRRKHHSILLLLMATAIWVLMEIYSFNFNTLVSWVSMAVVTCFFIWGNINRLLKKESPNLSRMEISEQTALDTANLFRQSIEEGIRLMFHVSCEREWFVFAGVLACLYLLSIVGSYLDLLTFSYIGVVGGMTIPVIYVKNEEKIKEYVEKLRIKSRRMYSMVEEKLQKIRNKSEGKHEEMKEKKME